MPTAPESWEGATAAYGIRYPLPEALARVALTQSFRRLADDVTEVLQQRGAPPVGSDLVSVVNRLNNLEKMPQARVRPHLTAPVRRASDGRAEYAGGNAHTPMKATTGGRDSGTGWSRTALGSTASNGNGISHTRAGWWQFGLNLYTSGSGRWSTINVTQIKADAELVQLIHAADESVQGSGFASCSAHYRGYFPTGLAVALGVGSSGGGTIRTDADLSRDSTIFAFYEGV